MSEFRQDLVSGDWIIISTERSKRPHQFKAGKRRKTPKKGCIFEDPKEAAKNGVVLASKPQDKKEWKLQVIPNKYPAVSKDGIWMMNVGRTGPFRLLPGYGYHEVLITKDHNDTYADLAPADALLVFEAFKERYKALAEDGNISYIHIFANYGESAGASVHHPHYQILAIPIIPPDVSRSLRGSQDYKKTTDSCVHCAQIAWERRQKKRIIFENKHAVVFAPYASKEPFEMRIFLKKHRPFFEDSSREELKGMADALQKALLKLKKALHDPDYNFFIHTSPSRNKDKHSHYHWHIEIFPKTNISAGFELGTSIEVNTMDPDIAAKFLRNA